MKAEVWHGKHLKILIVMWDGEHFLDFFVVDVARQTFLDVSRATLNKIKRLFADF